MNPGGIAVEKGGETGEGQFIGPGRGAQLREGGTKGGGEGGGSTHGARVYSPAHGGSGGLGAGEKWDMMGG